MALLNRKLETENTKRSYKKVVWFYDFWSRLTESKAAQKVLDYAEIKDGEEILEVACGTGIVFKTIVSRNPNGKNIGIDLSPDMLKKAKSKVKNAKKSSYDLVEGDALQLNFEENSFDTVINNFMVDLMPEDTFDVIAKEFYRLVKPNGKIIVSTFSFGKNILNKYWFWVAKNYPSLLTGCRPVSFKENLINAGFKIEKSIEISQNTFPSKIIRARKTNKE